MIPEEQLEAWDYAAKHESEWMNPEAFDHSMSVNNDRG